MRRDMRTEQPSVGFVLPWEIESNPGGVTHVVLDLMRECANEASYRPIAIQNDWAEWRTPQVDESLGLLRLRLRLRSPYLALFPVRNFLRYFLELPAATYHLLRAIRQYRILILSWHFTSLSAFTAVMLRRIRLVPARSILTFQGSDARAALQSKGFERALWRLMLRCADRLVFPSADLRDELVELDRRLLARSSVVHNGVNLGTFHEGTIRARRGPHEPEEGEEWVVGVADFLHRKGHDLLVRAFDRVAAERPEARLLLAGRRTEALADLRHTIGELGLEGRITILTDLPYSDMPAVVLRANVFVLSSRWRRGEYGEGLPLVLLEAGALARPVVSTASTGCGEVIRDGVTGRLVPLEDADRLAQAIIDLLADRKTATRMGLQLQQEITRNHNTAVIWQQFLRSCHATSDAIAGR